MAGGQIRRLFGLWFVVQSIFPLSFLVWPFAYLAVKRRRWVERGKETEAEIKKRQKFLEMTAAARVKTAQSGTLQKGPVPQKATAPVKRPPAPSRSAPERKNSKQFRSQPSPDRGTAPRRDNGTKSKSPGKEREKAPPRTNKASQERHSERSDERDHDDRERER